jgi:hypothetical protein
MVSPANEAGNGKEDKKKPSVLHVVGTTLLPIILTIALFYSVILLTPSPKDPCEAYIADLPTGTFGKKEILSSTSVSVEFGKIMCDPSPTKLNIILVLNESVEGRYMFQSNDDGAMLLTNGPALGTLTYEDNADNGRVNPGDKLVLTNLTPGSDYAITLFLAMTGDYITSTTFSTQ